MEIQPWIVITFKIIPVIIMIVIVIWLAYFLMRQSSSVVTTNIGNKLNSFITIFGINISKVFMSTLLLVIGGVPLLIYPFVFLANMMQLAAFGEQSNVNIYLEIIVHLFIITSILYPLTFICCFRSKKKTEKIFISALPLFHIAIILLIGYIWSVLERSFLPIDV